MTEPSLTLTVAPATSRGARGGRHRLTVTSAYAEAMRVDLSAFDPEVLVAFELDPPDAVVAPGGSVEAELLVIPNRTSLVRRQAPVTFVVSAHPERGATATATATYVPTRRLGALAAIVATALLVAGAVAGGAAALLGRTPGSRAADVGTAFSGGVDPGLPTTEAPASTAAGTTPPTTVAAAPSTTTAPPRPALDLIAFAAVRNGTSVVATVKPDGSGERVITVEGQAFEPALSPDGTRMAITRCTTCVGPDANFEIAVVDLATGAARDLTQDPAKDGAAAWSPDGSRLAFHSNRSGAFEIWTMAADGTDPVQVTRLGARSVGPAWSPDGSRLAFTSDSTGNLEVFTVAVSGPDAGAAPVDVSNAPGADADPAWSPDGRRLAFDSDRLGTADLWTVGVGANAAAPVQVTRDLSAETEPTWSPDGSSLAYVTNSRGNPDLAIVPAAGGAGRPLVATAQPEQSPDWR